MAATEKNYVDVAVQRNEDTRKRKRTVPMEVVSAGYSRTGTMSTQRALGILGIPTWHWISMAQNPNDMEMWYEALTAKWESESGIKPFGRQEFDNLLGYWGGTTDQPSAIVVEELINAYPEAKGE
jgi:hypothetical protein